MNHLTPKYVPIERYAVIGDCRSAALISDGGSVDWLCLPRFDSPSLFGAILDRERGGRFHIRPTGAFASQRRYVGETNVLETTFKTESGTVRLIDLMPVASEEDTARELWPERQLIRALYGIDGEVEIEVHYDPRPEYGCRVPRLVNRGCFGLDGELGSQRLVLRSDIPLLATPGHPGARGRATIRAGDRRYLAMAFSTTLPGVHPRMANETHGPTATRQLQPPGFMGLHYGRRTPFVSLFAHAAYGAILGAFYRLASPV